MKKAFMLLAILSLCQMFAFGQKKYEMVGYSSSSAQDGRDSPGRI